MLVAWVGVAFILAWASIIKDRGWVSSSFRFMYSVYRRKKKI